MIRGSTSARRAAEVVIVFALFVTASSWATYYWNRSFQAGRQPSFYQTYFEPAVMVACGHGFLLADPPVPSVTDFLRLRRDTLSCSEIPQTTTFVNRGLYQRAWLYLMWTVALAWRVLGVSWSGLGPLFGVLFGATIAAAYGIFRLGMGRIVSAACAVALAVSAVHLLNLPHLRDYAKAPFTLVLVLLILAAVAGPVTWRRLLTIGAAYGVVLGIGYGFRSDFLIDIPLFVVAIFGFLQGGVLRQLPLKVAATALCAAAFAATAWPIIRTVQERGGCQWHAVLLGLADGPTDALMVTRTPYSFGHDFSDGYVYASASAYALRTQPGIGHVEYCSHTYDVVTAQYALDVARTFPGDTLTRASAAVVQILQLPFRWFDQPLPGVWNALYRVRLWLLKPLRGSGVVFAALTLWVLTTVSVRLGVFALFFLAYVGGYPMLQFDVRHYFHLEFMTWWAIGFLTHQIVEHWRAAPDRRLRTAWSVVRDRYEWRHGAKVLGVVAVAMLAALWTARGYQQLRVTRLFQRYIDAPGAALEAGPVVHKTAGVHRVALGRDANSDPYPADLLEVDVHVSRCGAAPAVAFLYDRPFDSFTHTVKLADRAAAVEPTRVFEPVYLGFAGVQVLDAAPGCLSGIRRVLAPEQFPLLVSATLPPSWRRHALFEQLVPFQWRR